MGMIHLPIYDSLKNAISSQKLFKSQFLKFYWP